MVTMSAAGKVVINVVGPKLFLGAQIRFMFYLNANM